MNSMQFGAVSLHQFNQMPDFDGLIKKRLNLWNVGFRTVVTRYLCGKMTLFMPVIRKLSPRCFLRNRN